MDIMHNISIEIVGDVIMSKNKLFSILLLCILIITVIRFRNNIALITKSPEYFRDFIKSYGRYSIPIYIFFSSIRSVFLLPAGVFAVAAGITFGTYLGFILTLLGVTLSGIIAFEISKLFGGSFATKLFGNKIKTIEENLKGKGMLYIAMLRMIPIFPFDAISYVAGLCNVNVYSFTFGTFIGSIPGAFVYTYLGSNIFNMRSKQFILSLCLVIIISLIPLIYKYVIKKG